MLACPFPREHLPRARAPPRPPRPRPDDARTDALQPPRASRRPPRRRRPGPARPPAQPPRPARAGRTADDVRRPGRAQPARTRPAAPHPGQTTVRARFPNPRARGAPPVRPRPSDRLLDTLTAHATGNGSADLREERSVPLATGTLGAPAGLAVRAWWCCGRSGRGQPLRRATTRSSPWTWPPLPSTKGRCSSESARTRRTAPSFPPATAQGDGGEGRTGCAQPARPAARRRHHGRPLGVRPRNTWIRTDGYAAATGQPGVAGRLFVAGGRWRGTASGEGVIDVRQSSSAARHRPVQGGQPRPCRSRAAARRDRDRRRWARGRRTPRRARGSRRR